MLSVTTQLSTTESEKGIKNHLRSNYPWLLYSRPIGFIYFIFLWIVSFVDSASFSDIFYQMDYIQLLISINLFLLPYFFIWQAKYNIKKNPNFNKSIKWVFDHERLSAHGEGFSFSSDWTNINNVIFMHDGILIYPQKNLYHWISKTFFKNEDDINTLKSIIYDHVDKSKISERKK